MPKVRVNKGGDELGGALASDIPAHVLPAAAASFRT